MANFTRYFATLLKHEAGYQAMPQDKGNYFQGKLIGTKYGVTPGAFYDAFGRVPSVQEMKNLTTLQAEQVAKKLYWDPIKADQISSQSVAEFLFDWAYNSGVGRAAKKVQEALGLKRDGIIGPATLGAINNADARKLFNRLKEMREQFFRAIVRADKSQARFLQGWLNRNNSFTFNS